MIGVANVIRVTQAGEELIHICDRAVPMGNVRIQVSSRHRDLHTRLHSADHLIGYCGEKLDWERREVASLAGRGAGRLQGGDGAKPMTPDAIEQHVNRMLSAPAYEPEFFNTILGEPPLSQRRVEWQKGGRDASFACRVIRTFREWLRPVNGRSIGEDERCFIDKCGR